MKNDTSGTDKSTTGVRIIPHRGPGIANEHEYSSPEDAKAAHQNMADENRPVPFSNREALMRRLIPSPILVQNCRIAIFGNRRK